MDEHMSWMLYYHDGRMNVINGSSLVIDSFRVIDEGVAICQIKDNDGKVVDEKHFFLTSDRKFEHEWRGESLYVFKRSTFSFKTINRPG